MFAMLNEILQPPGEKCGLVSGRKIAELALQGVKRTF
jgi:hypothetical protein